MIQSLTIARRHIWSNVQKRVHSSKRSAFSSQRSSDNEVGVYLRSWWRVVESWIDTVAECIWYILYKTRTIMMWMIVYVKDHYSCSWICVLVVETWETTVRVGDRSEEQLGYRVVVWGGIETMAKTSTVCYSSSTIKFFNKVKMWRKERNTDCNV